jgi:hypothetical protein
MKAARIFLIVVFLTFASALTARSQSVNVPKTNPTPVYMHYMPWFQTPSSLGGTGGSQWGDHWKMKTQNPNIVDASGKRQIASHYYPKIGPYDSSDPNVIEYHLLLMKYSGIDGVMIDWYGVQGANGDVDSLRVNSENLIRNVDDYGLKFGVVLEDNFSTFGINGTPDIAKVSANVDYLRHNPNPAMYPNYPGYFENPAYIRYGAGNDPLLMNFGPIRFHQPNQWTQILANAGEDVSFLTLPGVSGKAGSNADGEFAWPSQDANTTNHLTKLRSFYISGAPSLSVAAGVAYPGFHDFYQQGGAGNTLFYVPENNGQTLTDTLNTYNTFKGVLDMLQLATFNDFGEGTMFEPTVETGFTYLNKIQQFTGVSYGTSELQLIYQLYLARKEYAGNAARQTMLDQVTSALNSLDVTSAWSLLAAASPAGDYNGDGFVNDADYNVWRSTYGSSTIIYGNGADGNFDGIVNAADYLIWRNSLTAFGSGASANVPEPTALGSLTVAAALLLTRRRARFSGRALSALA